MRRKIQENCDRRPKTSGAFFLLSLIFLFGLLRLFSTRHCYFNRTRCGRRPIFSRNNLMGVDRRLTLASALAKWGYVAQRPTPRCRWSSDVIESGQPFLENRYAEWRCKFLLCRYYFLIQNETSDLKGRRGERAGTWETNSKVRLDSRQSARFRPVYLHFYIRNYALPARSPADRSLERLLAAQFTAHVQPIELVMRKFNTSNRDSGSINRTRVPPCLVPDPWPHSRQPSNCQTRHPEVSAVSYIREVIHDAELYTRHWRHLALSLPLFPPPLHISLFPLVHRAYACVRSTVHETVA